CVYTGAAAAQEVAPDYAAIIAASDRTDADRQIDARRDPMKLLVFTAVRPGMKILDMGAGGGYSTELLARAVAPTGVVYGQKPGGMLVVADHSARAGDGTAVGKTFHRIEEGALRSEVEAAGFKLVGQGDFWRHPEDTRDFSVQPPSGKPIDEFVLKFQK